MKIYLDSDFKCHLENDGTLTEIETGHFNGKSKEYIEGYRFIPAGETFVDDKGRTILGGTVFPWKPYAELDAAQRQYERELAEAARILLGEVSV